MHAAGCGSRKTTPTPSAPEIRSALSAIASSSSKTVGATAVTASAGSSPTNLQRLTSVEIGHGGVWAMCPPQLLFIPIATATPCPTAPPRSCSMASPCRRKTTTTSPTASASVPTAGSTAAAAPPPRRTRRARHARRRPRSLRGTVLALPSQCGKIVEVLSSGTTNPWGHDWDERANSSSSTPSTATSGTASPAPTTSVRTRSIPTPHLPAHRPPRRSLALRHRAVGPNPATAPPTPSAAATPTSA
jgi:hypothetical protein